jgi:hypothetical protein
MQTISLPDKQVESMREFYLEELEKTIRRMEHLKAVLKELGEEAPTSVPAAKQQKVKRKRKARPGRKSVWEPLILKRLRQLDKPVTYEELTEEIMTLAKIPPEKKKSTKQAILSVAFRMRTRDNKIDTFSAGTREKYVGLRQWFDEPGKMSREYAKKITVRKAKVKKRKAKASPKK